MMAKEMEEGEKKRMTSWDQRSSFVLPAVSAIRENTLGTEKGKTTRVGGKEGFLRSNPNKG